MDWRISPVHAHMSWQQEHEYNSGDNKDFYGGAVPAAQQSPEDLLNSLLKPHNSNDKKQHYNNMRSTDGGIADVEAEQKKKLENERRAEELRAKLIAQRQRTPLKVRPGASRSEMSAQHQTLHEQENKSRTLLDQPAKQVRDEEKSPASDPRDVESLLAEGKAAANTKPTPTADTTSSVKTDGTLPLKHAASTPTVTSDHTADHIQVTAKRELRDRCQGMRLAKESIRELNPTSYYDDLPLWLEITGYHDHEYRNSKLQPYKAIEEERQELEQQAARIAARLQKLAGDRHSSIEALRRSVGPTPESDRMAPPPLPETLPTPTSAAATNGIKRAHSAERNGNAKVARTEEAGFRIRGTDSTSPVSRQNGGARRRSSRYSDDERPRSFSNSASRDPSLERRQQLYYGHPPNARCTSGRHLDNVANDTNRRLSHPETPTAPPPRGTNGTPGRGVVYRPRAMLSRTTSYDSSSRRGSRVELLPGRGRDALQPHRGGQSSPSSRTR